MKFYMSWQYIAAFVDGEGSVDIREYDNRKYKGSGRGHGLRGSISFCQSQKQDEVMDIISAFLTQHGIQHTFYKIAYKDSCPMTWIRMGHKKHMETFLKYTMKFMIVKRERAEKLLMFCRGGVS